MINIHLRDPLKGCVNFDLRTSGRGTCLHTRYLISASCFGVPVPLYWIVHEMEGEPCVFVQEASSLVYARMEAQKAGCDGKFIEAHELDRATAKKLPPDVIGRTLNRAKARAVLQRLRG